MGDAFEQNLWLNCGSPGPLKRVHDHVVLDLDLVAFQRCNALCTVIFTETPNLRSTARQRLQSTMAAAWDHMHSGILQTPSGIRLHS